MNIFSVKEIIEFAMQIEKNGVTTGDRFYLTNDKKSGNIYEVVDFWEMRSVVTNALIGYKCIAKGVNTLTKNEFEVPFSTVIRNKFEETK